MKHSVFHPPLYRILTLVMSLCLFGCSADSTRDIVVQAPLPYDEAALEPHISSQTMALHYGIHHAGYVKKANALIRENGLSAKTPEALLEQIAGKAKHQPLFNQAAQAWNHDFFWKCLKPQGGGLPPEALLTRITDDFGSFENFKAEFIAAGQGVFGSGWIWLVQDRDRLAVLATSNADTPLVQGLTPLFAIDVWEHSYYLDYQNRRADFVRAVIEHLANWDHAAALLDSGR
ncbi:superoxide dismutase [Desulfatiferula olefinivorans]